MEFQSLFPPAIAELALAAGLTVMLLGLLWLVGRVIPALGGRLHPALLMTATVVLQALLFVGCVILIVGFAGIHVAWLLLALTAAFGIGASVYRRKERVQPQPGLPSDATAHSLTLASPTMPAELPLAVDAQPVEEAPTVDLTMTVDLNNSAEPATTPMQPAVVASSDAALAVSSPAVVTAAAVPEAPEASSLDADEQTFLPPALPILPPWQHRTPAPLQPRRPLGQQTIRTLLAH